MYGGCYGYDCQPRLILFFFIFRLAHIHIKTQQYLLDANHFFHRCAIALSCLRVPLTRIRQQFCTCFCPSFCFCFLSMLWLLLSLVVCLDFQSLLHSIWLELLSIVVAAFRIIGSVPVYRCCWTFTVILVIVLQNIFSMHLCLPIAVVGGAIVSIAPFICLVLL